MLLYNNHIIIIIIIIKYYIFILYCFIFAIYFNFFKSLLLTKLHLFDGKYCKSVLLWNIIYAYDPKLHYSSLQCHMILQKL